jgi:hypothetical protein
VRLNGKLPGMWLTSNTFQRNNAYSSPWLMLMFAQVLISDKCFRSQTLFTGKRAKLSVHYGAY